MGGKKSAPTSTQPKAKSKKAERNTGTGTTSGYTTAEEVNLSATANEVFFTLLQNSHDAVWIVDTASGNVLACNDELVKLLELKDGKAIVGKSCMTYLSRSFDEKELQDISTSLSENRKWRGRVDFATAGSRKFPAEIIVTSMQLDDTAYMVTRIIDHSNEQSYREQLSESLQKLNLAEQSLGMGTWEYDLASNHIMWSDSTYRMFGLEPGGGLDYDSVMDLVHPDDREGLEKAIQGAAEKGVPYDQEIRAVHPNGDHRWIFVVGTAIFENGEIVRLIGSSIDINKVKEVENSLRDRDEQLSLILENIDESVYNISIDPDGVRQIQYVSPQIKRIFGFSAREYSEASARGFLEHYHPDDLDVIRQTSEKLRASREAVSAIYRFRPKNAKEYIWLEEKVFPKYDQEGVHVANFGILRNVTERVTAELLLRKSEEQFRNMFHHAPIGMAITDLDGNFHQVNQAFCKVIGYKAEELEGRMSFNDLSHPDDLGKSAELEQKLIDGTLDNFSLEKRYLRKNGKEMHTLLQVSAERDEKGKAQKFITQVVDITPRVEVEHALQVSEQQYRKLFERNLSGVFQSVNNSLRDCNPAFAHILGFNSVEDLHSISAYELFYDSKDRDAYLEDLKSNGFLTNYELRLKRRDGSPIWVLLNVSYHYDEENDVESIEGTLIDITESKNIRNLLSGIAQASGTLFTRDDLAASLSEALSTIGELSDLHRTYIFEVSNDHLAFLRHEWCAEGISSIAPDEGPLILNLKDYRTWFRTLRNGELYYAYTPRLRGKTYDLFRSWNVISVIMVPIFLNDRLWGFIGLDDCRSERHWSTYEQSTLLSLAVNLGNNIRSLEYKKHLEESEERFRLLSEATIEGILFTHHGKILDANDQFAHLHGYKSRDEIVGKMIADFVVAEDLQLVDEVIASGSEEKYEVRSTKKDGTQIVLESKGRYLPQSGLNIRVSVVYDITDRVKNEQALQKSRESFSNLVNYSPDGILIHSEGKIQFANPAALELLGLKSQDEVIDKSITDLFPEQYSQLLERRMAKLNKQEKTGERVEFEELHVNRPDGTKVELGIISVRTTYDGEPAIQATLHDLTQQKQLAKEQLRAQVAEDANRELEEEIRKHKITQQQLKIAEKLTRNIIDSSLDMIMATDTRNSITEFNRAAELLFGFSYDEVVGKHPKMLYAEQEDYKRVQRELAENGSFSGEIRNVKKDGTVFTTYLAASLLRNEKGKLEGAMGVSRDITESIKTQRKIREQAAKIQSIFESSSHLIWSVNHEKCLTSFNQNFSDNIYELYGLRPELNHRVIDNDRRISKDYNRLWDRKYEACLNGKPQHFETSLTDQDGEERWQEIFLHPIYGTDGEVLEVSGIGHDITYKKQAERQLEEQSAKIRSIFESTSHMMIFTLDRQFKLTSFNRNFAERMGSALGQEVTMGMEFLEAMQNSIDAENWDDFESYYKGAIRGKSQLFEGPMKLEDGSVIWIETFLNPIFLEMGKIREISCLAHEITDKKAAERQIKSSLKEKEVLLKEVHHRVKNNLQVISSILNLQSSYVKDKNTLDILKESQNRIKSMSFIHESLYQTKNFSSIDFSDYILNLSKNLVHSYRVYDDSVDLDLEIKKVYLNLDQAIPCGLIVNELVSNSLKYAFPDERGGKIRISLSQENQQVRLHVEDTGIGLPEGFDYRNTDSLGLQLVVTLVEQLDGEMELDSTAGTKYLITFDQI